MALLSPLDVLIGFKPISYTYGEDSGTATIHIVRLGDSDSDTTVTFSTVDGSARGKHVLQLVLNSSSAITILLYISPAPLDYIATTQQVVFAPDEKEKIVSVPIVDDNVLEGEEMFSANLTTNDAHVSLFNSSASVSISDNDSEYMYMRNNFIRVI